MSVVFQAYRYNSAEALPASAGGDLYYYLPASIDESVRRRPYREQL